MKKNTMILAAMGLTAALCAGSVMSASAEEKESIQHRHLPAGTARCPGRSYKRV